MIEAPTEPTDRVRVVPVVGRSAALICAALGTAAWLSALVAGAVASTTIWGVVGGGMGAFLLGYAVRDGGDHRREALATSRTLLARTGIGVAVLAALVVGGALLAGRPELVLPLLTLVVGGAAIPLAAPLAWRSYRVTGILLCVTGLVGLVIASTGGAGMATFVTGGVAGIVLWVASSALVAASPVEL